MKNNAVMWKFSKPRQYKKRFRPKKGRKRKFRVTTLIPDINIYQALIRYNGRSRLSLLNTRAYGSYRSA